MRKRTCNTRFIVLNINDLMLFLLPGNLSWKPASFSTKFRSFATRLK